MNRVIACLCFVLAAAIVNMAEANVVNVPSLPFIVTIQDGINHAGNGDTVSVWGPPPGQDTPPYVYHENVVFPQNISLTVVNRSFLGTTPSPPSWDRVVIAGLPNGPTPSKSRR
ncbi:MAG: hypothetical protein NTX53_03555 [candidate division WOR-3 bacterium]|nr:hypothetical protein [candidate division WOR-3 bacterium]